jgi:hypothetical protein
MRKKLAVAAGGGLTLAVALAIPAGAQVSVSHSGSAYVKATPATVPVLKRQGCGSMWNEGYEQYATVEYEIAPYQLNFVPLSYFGISGAPYFCNLSVTNVSGVFEIEDPNNPGACLAVNTAVYLVTDDTPSACTEQNYAWDQWNGINTHTTYHSQTVWEFKNRYNGECLANDGGYDGLYAACRGSDSAEYFVWTGSNL